MGKKKWIIIPIVVLLLLLIVGGTLWFLLGERPENIAPAENSVKDEFYSYSTYEGSPDIKIDGVLDDSVWEGKKWWKNTYVSNVNGNMPSIELTAFPTEYGVYIGSVVYDTNLTSDGQRAPGSNSNWELYLGACDAGEDLFSAENIGAWNVHRIYVDMYGDSYTFFANFDRAVVVEGELNSSNTTKATLEMYVPWDVLGVDITKGIPETVGILPCYRAVLQVGGDTSWMSPIGHNLDSTTDMYLFDSTGYFNADESDCLIGDGFNGYAKTKGWDLSQIEDGIVHSTRGGWDQIFFTDMYGENFIMEATIIPVAGVNDSWPKTGFIFQKLDGQYYTIWLDPNGTDTLVDSINGTKNFPDYRITTLNNDGGWNQVTLSGYDMKNPNATKQEGVKLTVVKHGSTFWYFADGKFLISEDISYMDGDSMPGFWSLGMDCYFKDYSCEEINAERLTEYLNEKSLYIIEAATEGPGGTVTASKTSLRNGESYELAITTKPGYRVKSVQINGEDIYTDVSQNAVGGVYTVKNVQGNQNVIVTFEKCDEVTYSGTVAEGENVLDATMTLTGVTDKSLYYVQEISAKKGFSIQLPAGTYELLVTSEGYKGVETTIELTADKEETIQLEVSDFGKSQRVNGKNVSSAMDKYDLSNEHNGKIYGSYSMGTRGDTLYFRGTGTDFVAQVTMKYTTQFDTNGSYQADLIGGFAFSDGTNEYVLWARDNGIIYTVDGWQYVMNIFNKSVLMYPNPNTAVFTVAKLGENVYVYLDGKEVFTAKWSDIAPNIDPSSEVAVGLDMWTDKEAELEFSDYSVNFDSEYVSDFVNSH